MPTHKSIRDVLPKEIVETYNDKIKLPLAGGLFCEIHKGDYEVIRKLFPKDTQPVKRTKRNNRLKLGKRRGYVYLNTRVGDTKNYPLYLSHALVVLDWLERGLELPKKNFAAGFINGNHFDLTLENIKVREGTIEHPVKSAWKSSHSLITRYNAVMRGDCPDRAMAEANAKGSKK